MDQAKIINCREFGEANFYKIPVKIKDSSERELLCN